MKYYFLSVLMTLSWAISAQNSEKQLRGATLSELQKEFVGKKVIIKGPIFKEHNILLHWELAKKRGGLYVTKFLKYLPANYFNQQADIIAVQPAYAVRKKMKSNTNAFGEVVNKNPYIEVIVKFKDGTKALNTNHVSTLHDDMEFLSDVNAKKEEMTSIIPKIVGDTLYADGSSNLFVYYASLEQILSENNDIVKANDFPRFEPIVIIGAKYFTLHDVLILKLKDTNNKKYLSYITAEVYNLTRKTFLSDNDLELIADCTNMLTGPETLSYSEKEIQAIKKGTFYKGMSVEALHLSIGLPDKENVNSYGGNQLVYYEGSLYIYLDKDNETVESWQFQK